MGELSRSAPQACSRRPGTTPPRILSRSTTSTGISSSEPAEYAEVNPASRRIRALRSARASFGFEPLDVAEVRHIDGRVEGRVEMSDCRRERQVGM